MRKIKLFMTAAFLMLAASVSAQTYTWVENGKSFTDGTLLYTLGSYRDTQGTTASLAANEVAVSLFLQPTTDQSIQVTDTIWTKFQTDGNHGWGQGSGYQGKPKTDGGEFSPKGTGISSSIIGQRTNEGVVIEDDDDNADRYFWKRVINCAQNGININTASTVTIPTTVTFNNTPYDVVAIPYGGFCIPDLCTLFVRTVCGNYGGKSYYWECMQGKNPFLTTVNIANDSKLRDIGAYAFVGCGELQSIMIPKGVVKIGEGAFEFCQKMTTVTFQTNADGLSSSLQTIDGYAFYGDGKITSLDFNEGLVTIGDLALIYNFKLTHISLPNTLVNIGAHFLCDAKSIPTLTIPANVTNIDGAFLHGCENLKTVYMLGYPSNLKVAAGTSGDTFDGNPSFCQEHVQNCHFYVPEKYLTQFQNDAAWAKIDDNGSNSPRTNSYGKTSDGYGNYLEKMPVVRPFEARKWTTAIFPKGVTGYKNTSEFGPASRFAEYVSCEYVGDDIDPKSGKHIRMYTLHFQIISGNDIPAGRVGMFYPDYSKPDYVLWTAADETATFIADETKPHAVGHTAGDGAYIFMSGYYVPHKLQEWDFYLSASTNQFMRVRAGKEPTAALCRCFWTVNMEGLRAPAAVGAKKGFFDDESTDIGTMTIAVEEPSEVYDLSGRRVNASMESLKSGIYVVNGKKVVIK